MAKYNGGMARAIGRLLIPQFVQQGMGSNEIQRQFKAMGLGWRRQVMLADIREVTGMMKLERIVRAIPRNQLPRKSHVVETDLRRARKYRVHAEITYEDTETGEIITKKGSFYTDTLDTPAGWEDQYIEMKRKEDYKPDQEVLAVQPVSIEHNKGFRY